MKAAKTRALHKHQHPHAAPAHHAAHAHHKAKKAPKAKKAQPKRTAAQVKAAHVRAWSPGDVSCCSAEALAASLRLAGWLVPPAEVLALYRRTADSPDAGASLLATLEAASVYGLGAVRPVEAVALRGEFREPFAEQGIDPQQNPLGTPSRPFGEFLVTGHAQILARFWPVDPEEALVALTSRSAAAVLCPARTGPDRHQVYGAVQAPQQVPAYVLGLDLPEAPHAVCLDPSGAVWSWGGLCDLTGEAVIEEAWAVEWLIPPALCIPLSS